MTILDAKTTDYWTVKTDATRGYMNLTRITTVQCYPNRHSPFEFPLRKQRC